MGWFSRLFTGAPAAPEETAPALPSVPTSDDILAALDRVGTRTEGRVPGIVAARIQRIDETVREMVPRLDRLGGMSRQGHTVVATATSYLPEAVEGYLRLPRDFADRRAVHRGKTSLMILCDQLDLLGGTLDRISDAVSRQDASALIAHGQFLAEKFTESSLSPSGLDAPPQPGAPSGSGSLTPPSAS
ncbi:MULTISPECIES: hypothetical protein [unclassified Rathayibacter]|uniref:hypothetical protein n=1 Tax=unclassified Rathayibacter TaxID=2609250 RepID=UPI000CE8D702|nr:MULTISPECIES: hypothetical protein [unclassified Rathayibacter]PPF29397.1 hypothetical protein C5C54_04400 [Rathayibacter sp. AY1F2]PPG17540.1 hypothetical protein C5D36_04605 [Rathayibacter sp. AY1C6]PPH09898.1 hypothetical protein C5C71_10630 [Rathayibacter sp. AY1C1]PPH37463.1 hypothetical protein C5C53_06655 [Rathayibacter sp. AY1E3]PPH45104.1 hypothetical protein C5D09_11660 [Rathayibacter sp. AY1C9]